MLSVCCAFAPVNNLVRGRESIGFQGFYGKLGRTICYHQARRRSRRAWSFQADRAIL
ncbi:protein of unknown function [Magnetospirillum sp. XM-1]|nr:protein of unknown function [Magnetospirillum sp. XM-1]